MTLLSTLREWNVRVNYAAAREPTRWAFVFGVLLFLFAWLIGRNLAHAAMFGATYLVIGLIVGRGAWKRQQFARWAAKHPHPDDRPSQADSGS